MEFFEALKKVQNICLNNGFDNPELLTEQTEIASHLDSLDVVELCIGVENIASSNLSIPDAEMENWKTFGDVARTLLNHENESTLQK